MGVGVSKLLFFHMINERQQYKIMPRQRRLRRDDIINPEDIERKKRPRREEGEKQKGMESGDGVRRGRGGVARNWLGPGREGHSVITMAVMVFESHGSRNAIKPSPGHDISTRVHVCVCVLENVGNELMK